MYNIDVSLGESIKIVIQNTNTYRISVNSIFNIVIYSDLSALNLPFRIISGPSTVHCDVAKINYLGMRSGVNFGERWYAIRTDLGV